MSDRKWIKTRDFTVYPKGLATKGLENADKTEIRLIWARNRKEVGNLLKVVSPGAYKRYSKGGDNFPYGLCIPEHPRGSKDPWPRKGYRKFMVIVSGTGRSCLDTLAHEIAHVVHRMKPENEEAAASLTGLLIAEMVPNLAVHRPSCRISKLFC